jgi:hypothetical protein
MLREVIEQPLLSVYVRVLLTCRIAGITISYISACRTKLCRGWFEEMLERMHGARFRSWAFLRSAAGPGHSLIPSLQAVPVQLSQIVGRAAEQPFAFARRNPRCRRP